MPRYAALGDAHGLSTLQTEVRNNHLRTRHPTDLVSAEGVDAAIKESRSSASSPESGMPSGGFGRVVGKKVVLHYFDAPDLESANRYYKGLVANGCPQDINFIGNASSDSNPNAAIWRNRADSHLHRRISTYGLEKSVSIKDVQSNTHFRNLNNLLNQLCDLYFKSRKQDGVAILPEWQLAQVRGTLDAAEKDLAKMIVLATAGADAMAGAYWAFDVEPERTYTTPELKPLVAPVPAEQYAALEARFGDVGRVRDMTRAQLDGLRIDMKAVQAENERLKAELAQSNADLAALKSAAEPESTGTPHKNRPRRGE